MEKKSLNEITNLLKENGYGTPRINKLIIALSQRNLCLSDVRCHENSSLKCIITSCEFGCQGGCKFGCPAGRQFGD
jgi:hypothetical protein